MRIFITILILSITIFSQDLSTPRKSVENHLKYLQQETYQPKTSVKSLYNSTDVNLAKKLKKFFDSKGLYVILDDIPDDANYVDSLTGDKEFILFEKYPNIYLKRYDGKWQYSKQTVNLIPEFYKDVLPPELENFLSNMPPFLLNKFLGLMLWKWLGILLIFILSIIAFWILNKVLGYYVFKYLSRVINIKRNNQYNLRFAKILSLIFVLLFIETFLPLIQLPVKISSIIANVIKVLFPILITIMTYKFTDVIGLFFEKVADKTESKVDDQLVPLLRKTLKIAVVIIGGLYILKSTGIDITTLTVGASVGGLALALAAQDTLKNFFGSITIFTDKPFDVGDWIVFGDKEGTVEEVGVRSSRVRTFYNSQVSIPNGKISDMMIDNMGRREFRRYSTKLDILYETNPEKIEEFVEGLREIVRNSKYTRKDYFEIHLNDFASSSLQVLVYIFFEVNNWTEELEGRQEFILSALKLSKRIGVEFAYPTQTLYIDNDSNNNKENI